MAIIERAARLTEIKSEPRYILKKGYRGITVPDYPGYDVKTADLKVIVYQKWFALEDGPNVPTSFRKTMRNNCLSALLDPITKPELPKVTYLLHHDKFPVFIANADTIETATNGGATFQLENVNGTPISAGRINRFEIVPSSKGNLAPEIFDVVVEWAYTGNYKGYTGRSDKWTNRRNYHLDKKVAIASLLMGQGDLLVLAIEKLRARMDLATDTSEKEKEENIDDLIDSLAKGGAEDLAEDADDEGTEDAFQGAIREAVYNAVSDALGEEGHHPKVEPSIHSIERWGKKRFYPAVKSGERGGRKGGGGWRDGHWRGGGSGGKRGGLVDRTNYR
ncbi:hypothetical protein TWF481_003566 [Arthrobotrys musiformis]|uniref:Uncharacterized protein n=1 Tax=Arthrobotrys musiformis TaxID=47236 RepID=A0AAV9WGZ4_9PEZI